MKVEAHKADVVMPNKHAEDRNKFYEGHLLGSETYVGGHVEALESGVFRSDLPVHFRSDPRVLTNLLANVDRSLEFYLTVEEKIPVEEIVNYSSVRKEIADKLQHLLDSPLRHETPLIYHLDVAAMYPNIILTNRLQPPAQITEETCAR